MMETRDDAYERLRVQDLIDWYSCSLEDNRTMPGERSSMARIMAALIVRRDRIDARIRRRETPDTEPATDDHPTPP